MINVTYETITPESAERGDVDDHGFIDAHGAYYSMDGIYGPDAEAIGQSCRMPLSVAVGMIGCLDSGSDGLTYYEADGRLDPMGEYERRALHLPRNATPATINRIARILKAHRLAD